MTILITLCGKLGDIYSSKKILLYSSFFVLFLLPMLYFGFRTQNIVLLCILGILYIFPIASITAIYPYWVAHIFRPKIRYTAVGLAFNFADGIIGGFSPAIAQLMYEFSGNQGAFCWYVLICSVVSIISYFMIREHKIKEV